MGNLQITPDEYLTELRMSRNKILMVEGPSDRLFFKLLIDSLTHSLPFSPEQKHLLQSIKIDTADRISGGIGNRDKVEQICERISERDYQHRIIGFVDREFREFVIGDDLDDRIRAHKRAGRLIWSRGHSVENYLFDFSVVREPLRDSSATSLYFDEALDLLQENFDQAIRLACAFTLAGREQNLFEPVRSSLSWRSLQFVNGNIQADTSTWSSEMLGRIRLNHYRVDKLLDDFNKWYSVVANANIDVARWLCHGHIGLAVIWCAYGRCIHEVYVKHGSSNPAQEVNRALRMEESRQFSMSVGAWTRHALGNHIDSPMFCLQALAGDAVSLSI
jgi:hypothetical protein